MIPKMKKPEKKKPGPKATGKGEQINVRLLPDLLGAVDRQLGETTAESRAEAIRTILTAYFKRKGWL